MPPEREDEQQIEQQPAESQQQEPPAEPEKTDAEKAVEAWDEGEEEAAPAPPVNERKGDEGDEYSGDPADGDGGDGGKDAGPDGADDETDEQRAEREKSERDAAAKAEDDKAVKDLGLRGKAEQRFRDLSGQVRDLSQQLEAVGGEEAIKAITELGGKEGLQRTIEDAKAQHQWDQQMAQIGCTPDQFGQAMGVLAAINSDDPAVLRQVRDNLLKEIGLLDDRLGEKTDRHDPLEKDPELRAKVQRGEMDEEDALEILRLRRQAEASTQRNQQATQQQQAQQAQQQGAKDLSDIGAELRQRDGDKVFAAKMKIVAPVLDKALPQLPPAQWKQYAADLYASVQLPKAAQPPRVGKSPVRQSHGTTGAAGDVHRNNPPDPMDAFDQGVAEARELGM